MKNRLNHGMKVEFRKNRLIVVIEDDVILNNASLYEAVVDSLSRAPSRKVAFDLSRLEHLDDLNTTMLMKIIERFTSKGYAFSLLNPGKSLLKYLVFRDISTRVTLEFDEGLRENKKK